MLTPWPYPRWIAHRGGGCMAPENTLAAFRVGAELDVALERPVAAVGADGVPFLLHDDTLDRTTPASGVAGERPWSELSLLDAGGWHSAGFAGEPMASLAAIAAFLRRNDHALNLEIKPTPRQAAATGRAVALEAARLWLGHSLPPLLSSFDPAALAAARDAAPDLPRALLLDALAEGWFALAASLGCKAVVTEHSLMDADLIARLHGAGMRALCYTVNEPGDAMRLLGLGIDGIVTDAVDRFIPTGAGNDVFG